MYVHSNSILFTSLNNLEFLYSIAISLYDSSCHVLLFLSPVFSSKLIFFQTKPTEDVTLIRVKQLRKNNGYQHQSSYIND